MRNQNKVSGGRAGDRDWLLVLPLAVLSLSALLVSCTPLRIQYPIEVSDGDWITDGRSINRDRVSQDSLIRLPIEQVWIYNAAAGFGAASPLIVADMVFVGTRKGEMHVVELEEGERVGTQEFGHAIEGSPALVDQILYVPNAWGGDALRAFDLRQGSNLWKHRGVPIEASVLAFGDRILAGDVEGNVIAFNRRDGLIDWVYEFSQMSTIFAGPTGVDEEHVVVATENGDVACLRVDDGTAVWTRSLDGSVEGSIATGNDRVFIPTTRGTFHAIDTRSGASIWTYRVPGETVRFTGAALAEDVVVFGGSDGILRALDVEQGRAKWTFTTDGAFTAAPAISGNLIFVGAMDREFYAIGLQDGSVQWSTTLRGRVKSAAAIRKGLVIVMSEPKYVYAFGNVDALASL